MIFALKKYNDAPTMVVGDRKTIDTLDKTILITICKTSQFHYNRFRFIGYPTMTQYMTGQHSNNKNISWSGNRNMTFHEAKTYLFESGTEERNVYSKV